MKDREWEKGMMRGMRRLMDAFQARYGHGEQTHAEQLPVREVDGVAPCRVRSLAGRRRGVSDINVGDSEGRGIPLCASIS